MRNEIILNVIIVNDYLCGLRYFLLESKVNSLSRWNALTITSNVMRIKQP